MAQAKVNSRRSWTPLDVLLQIGFAAVDTLVASSQTVLQKLVWSSQPSRQSVVVSDDPASLSQLVHLFHSELGAKGSELISILNALTTNRDQLQRAVIAWLDLIEVLVQTSEAKYGTTPGMGKIKTEDVKRTLIYLLESGSFSIPNVPRPLATLIVNTVVEWAIDVIVLQANSYNLWETSSVNTEAPNRFWQMVKGAIRTQLLKLANVAALIINWIGSVLHPTPHAFAGPTCGTGSG